MLGNDLDFYQGMPNQNQPYNTNNNYNPQANNAYNPQMQNTYAPPPPTFSQHRNILEKASIIHGGFPGEPSLFEELGLHTTDIKKNLRQLLFPNKYPKPIDQNYLASIFMIIIYAFSLLFFKGPKFGSVYIVTVLGLIVLYFIFQNISKAYAEKEIVTLSIVFTAMSYCVLPLIPIAVISSLFRFSLVGKVITAIPFVGWATYCATRYLSQYYQNFAKELIAPPFFIFYYYMFFIPLL
ncbi:hypothetical protein TVAG_117010 [Trichomonas vaginalis G3]|uniref:Protein YIPF n=1 Tax=Trichomonas vaginalis (strain ATCC PRA-98 / G3) TaxID=412133 RepID=A2E3P1_TRIV3|nr:vesicle-mediated transport [Trichomonas vaginalis G3]EAY12679.1 hypothetical protein TVAG_117010 [Trichomonas vaginalis G3]KAI5517559.1 vesicle-mediated transport [Trichomonas vaginalis G3]|eukprot:XP_001324902.1 hypothetical protein [Trichomonas vaginalis G3]